LKVILDDTLVYWRTDERTGKDEKIVLPKVFRDQGVPLTFQVSGATASTLGNSYLWYQAAIAVKYGMPVDEALRAVTLLPAEMLGVAEFVGSIEPNKDADLVILNGDPLKVSTWVETTIVGGRVVYERAKDEKLKRLLQEPRK
jgi:imidazolonepropionase-like amidohydrolase